MTEFNLLELLASVAEVVPEREALVYRGQRSTFAELLGRAEAVGGFLAGQGLGCHTERSELGGHEKGQATVALLLHNHPAYLEAMLGCFAARAAPFNVNHRYVAEELEYVLADAGARAIVYDGQLAANVAEIRGSMADDLVLIQLEDDSGAELLPGAVWWSTVVEHEAVGFGGCSPDDLYMLYTGGTTGQPKGVLWRQADFFVGALGGFNRRAGREFESYDELAERAATGSPQRWLTAAPFMHGAAQWIALQALSLGHTVVLSDEPTRFDPASVLATVEREGVANLQIVGDAFARPLLEAITATSADLSSLKMLISGGAPLSAGLKQTFSDRFPGLLIRDSIGSSETGVQGRNDTRPDGKASTGVFKPNRGALVVAADLSRVLEPGDPEVGWFGMVGRVPLGYLGDADKTARTFPVIDGVRVAVPGDRARWLDDGSIDVLGRDSVTINSGGEKVFAEEVEAALKTSPAVWDVIVCGRPSERWGSEVVALVHLHDEVIVADEELVAACEGHLARYKWPKLIIRVEEVKRSPAGKPDYGWAKEVAATR
ncbi:MAG: acyl-CoA synthetase [Actinomycetia bacterium]|nr:acyl-CoA synthetase [Actinomycetes bacterium]